MHICKIWFKMIHMCLVALVSLFRVVGAFSDPVGFNLDLSLTLHVFSCIVLHSRCKLKRAVWAGKAYFNSKKGN